MCPYRDYVDADGLMAYTVNLAELMRHLARRASDSQRGQTRRHPDLSAHQVRAPDQPEDGKSTRPPSTAGAARPRRRDHRIVIVFGAVHPSALGTKRTSVFAVHMSAFGSKADILLKCLADYHNNQATYT